MKNENEILMMNNNLRDLKYTGRGERESKKTFFTKTLPKLVDEIQNKTFNEIDSQGQRIKKVIIPSNIIDIYTRLEALLGLKYLLFPIH